MEVLLPSVPLSSNALSECEDIEEFDEFFMAKLAYIHRHSDLDVYQLEGNERITHLLCGWEAGNRLIKRFENEKENLPTYLEHFLVNLVHYTMNLWFSLEWEQCETSLCCSLLVSMFRKERTLLLIPCLKNLNWDFLMNLGSRPWNIEYFRNLTENMHKYDDKAKTSSPTIFVESVEELASTDDIDQLRKEGLVITLLRLFKLFDVGSMALVRRYSMRVIAAWNQIQQQEKKDKERDEAGLKCFVDNLHDLKRCLNLICHIHLMAIYEHDDASGFKIDNMINNIRFYYKTICDAQSKGCKRINIIEYKGHTTPAFLVAMTCVKLDQTVGDFLESVIADLSRESYNTLFGAIAHVYTTYLLGSILVEMNKLSEEDFETNVEKYKKTLRAYVEERERSEIFMKDEVRKQKLQSTCHNITCTVKDMTNFKTAIGKGNRSTNLNTHKKKESVETKDKSSEETTRQIFDFDNEKQRFDPVFQTMPNNQVITNEFYEVLSKTKYKGWHFAKLVLLVKIIGRELNDNEKWCYHPGLTTDFMMGVERKLAGRFEDLACIFQDHIFMEQEFWLTAFYLHPVREYYEKVIHCGTRYQRTVNLFNKGEREEVIMKPTERSTDAADDNMCAIMNAKYGLLSSTFDVKQIAQMTNFEALQTDYNSLEKALRKLRLPENIIQDLLIVTFSPRHANFTWAVEWPILRKRCKMLLNNPEYKRKLVESNMAEANDRLKYLKIDYTKYRNLPQLDYGTIEEGYENDYLADEADDDDDDDDDDSDDDDPKIKIKEKKKMNISSDGDTLPDSSAERQCDEDATGDYGAAGGLRRISARRAAAVIASAMLKEDSIAKPNKKKEDLKDKPPLAQPEQNPDISSAADTAILSETTSSPEVTENPVVSTEPQEYQNGTLGFVKMSEIWNFQKSNILEFREYSSLLLDVLNKVNNVCNDSPNNSNDEPDNGDDDSKKDDELFTSRSESDNSHGHISDCEVNVSDNETNEDDDSSSDNEGAVVERKPNESAGTSANNRQNPSSEEKLEQKNIQESSEQKTSNSLKKGENGKENKIEMHEEEVDCARGQETFQDNNCNVDSFLREPKSSTDVMKLNEQLNEITSTQESDDQNEHATNSKEASKYSSTIETQENVVSSMKDEILIGKPKSFKQFLTSQQMISDDSSSQYSNGTNSRSQQSSQFYEDRNTTTNSEVTESGDEEKEKEDLKENCLKRKCFVRLERLQCINGQPLNLRQARVRIKRLNLEKYLEEKDARRHKSRSQSKPKYFDSEESSSPAPLLSSIYNVGRKRHNMTSATGSESEEEYNPGIAKRRSISSNRRTPLQMAQRAQEREEEKKQRARTKSFSVVPRSPSGLKVCISSLCEIRPPTDCIEISSSSSSNEAKEEEESFPVEFASIDIVAALEDDPLFEEEADISLLR